RTLKENIEDLNIQEALTALFQLNPVKYNYKADKTDKHVGFIAEDVPELVATADRKGLSPMDITAVLTKVVQELKKKNQACKELIAALQERVSTLENK
ncbi:MAG TPA: tail fiber domain-containing protein, partial [Candidatus Deferrimicrobium sp.]|nr:tail fiber domain-containing protein [Candidatus Deferrimicrobium sp.]